MYNHNKAQQSKNRVHISWDILSSGDRYRKSCKILWAGMLDENFVRFPMALTVPAQTLLEAGLDWRLITLRLCKGDRGTVFPWANLTCNLARGPFQRDLMIIDAEQSANTRDLRGHFGRWCLQSQHGKVITSTIKCSMKLLVHSQTSTERNCRSLGMD